VIRQEWLQPIAPDAPCGPNLEYDQKYLALEDAARGRPETQYGSTADGPDHKPFISPATEPDWRDVVAKASALLDETRDLRVVMLLTRGLVSTEGLPGLRDGLMLARGLLENQWDAVHPQLEDEGVPDPVLRMNALSMFADSDGMVRDARHAVCIRSALGTLTVRDVERVLDPATPAEGRRMAPEQLRAVIREVIAADANALTEVAGSIQAIDDIRRIVLSHYEPSVAPDLAPLRKPLQIVGDLIESVRADLVGQAAPGAEGSGAGGGEKAAGTPGIVGVGEIRSRDDAVRALERVCEYLVRHEPTNPAPLLIRRAQRVMTMQFLDIIRELAPEAAGQVETITGKSGT
jgi:type VI secretion system protein ImpA